MAVKNTSYVTIQAFMVNDLHLGGNELIIYAVIFGFSQDGESWFTGSRAYLAQWCQASKMTVTTNLKKLVDKGLIEKRTRVENGVTFAHYRAVDLETAKDQLDGGSRNFSTPVKNLERGGQETLTGGGQETLPHTLERDNLEEKIGERAPEPSELKKPKKKQIRHRYGEYGHVLLTDDEYERLDERTDGHRSYYIKAVDSHCEKTGKRYKRYFAACGDYYDRDKEKGWGPFSASSASKEHREPNMYVNTTELW